MEVGTGEVARYWQAMGASSMVGHRHVRRNKGFQRLRVLNKVRYLLVLDLVAFLASPLLASADAASVASGTGSPAIEVRKSPRQTIHVSAMSCLVTVYLGRTL